MNNNETVKHVILYISITLLLITVTFSASRSYYLARITVTDNINDILDKFDEEKNIDKLKYIKYLYQNNHQKIADKLLKQYEKEFNKDKNISKQVLQLRKNKLLYINQGKYSC